MFLKNVSESREWLFSIRIVLISHDKTHFSLYCPAGQSKKVLKEESFIILLRFYPFQSTQKIFFFLNYSFPLGKRASCDRMLCPDWLELTRTVRQLVWRFSFSVVNLSWIKSFVAVSVESQSESLTLAGTDRTPELKVVILSFRGLRSVKFNFGICCL